MDMINPISPRQSNRVSDYFCNPREALRRLDKSRPRDGEPRVRAGPDDYLRVLLAHRHKQAINSRLPTWSIDIILIKYPYISIFTWQRGCFSNRFFIPINDHVIAIPWGRMNIRQCESVHVGWPTA